MPQGYVSVREERGEERGEMGREKPAYSPLPRAGNSGIMLPGLEAGFRMQ